MFRNFKYSYTMPKGAKRFIGIAHGNTWEEAKVTVKQYYPKRSNLKLIKVCE